MLFKNKYRELRSGYALVLSMVFVLLLQVLLGMAIGVAASIIVGQERMMSDFDAYVRDVTNITTSPLFEYVLYSVMIGGLLLLFWLLYKRPVKQMGLYACGWVKQLLLGCLMGIVLMALAVVLLLVTGTAKLEGFNGSGFLQILFWAGLIKYIYVGFFEELLSRGFMMTALKTTRVKWVIVLLPSVLFGLLHIFNNNVTFFSLANIALVGVLFSYMFIKTGRLWAPIGLHITWNFSQGFLFGIPVSGSAVPDSAITSTLFAGPEWLTGGAFGVEGGAACTLVILLGLVFVRFCMKSPENAETLWRMDSDLPLTRGTLTTEAHTTDSTGQETA